MKHFNMKRIFDVKLFSGGDSPEPEQSGGGGPKNFGPNKSPRRKKPIFLIFALLLGIWFLSSSVSPENQPTQVGVQTESGSETSVSKNAKPGEMDISAMVRAANDGVIARVIESQYEVAITLTSGRKVEVILPEGKTFDQVLLDNGVTPEVLAGIHRIERPESEGGFALFSFLPIFLLIGVMIWIYKKQAKMSGGGGGFGAGNDFTKSQAEVFRPGQINVSFKDVEGCNEAKRELEEVVEHLKNPTKLESLGGKACGGVILHGPSGTGKTLLAKALAGEANVSFLSNPGSGFIEVFVGVGASRIRSLFKQGRELAAEDSETRTWNKAIEIANENAKKRDPNSTGERSHELITQIYKKTPKEVGTCVIFIDEIDGSGRTRKSGPGSSPEQDSVLNQLLTEMDGFEEVARPNIRVLVVAATNRLDMLDPALLRSGRFSKKVMVALPDAEGRYGILGVHARKMCERAKREDIFAEDVDFREFSLSALGCSGADLENILNEAANYAARRGHKQITVRDLIDANDKVLYGGEPSSNVVPKEEKRRVAFHETGHALVAHFGKGPDKVRKISIVPRGEMGGFMLSLPDEELKLMTEDKLMDQLAQLFGGLVAEKLALGKHSNGASNDLERASQICEFMVTRIGMSGLGFRVLKVQEFSGYTCSESYKQKVDEAIEKLLQAGYDAAEEILKDKKELLNKVTEVLLEKENLTGAEFEELVKSAK